MDKHEMLEKAIEIAVKSHKGQTDKSGEPYILHPLRVMLSLESQDERICGVLHDVIEDTRTTLQDLRNAGFKDNIIQVIDLISKNKNETYSEYIDRVLTNEFACKVKIADIKDHMTPERINKLDEKTRTNLLIKYTYALGEINKTL